MELKTILGVMAIAWTVWTEYRILKITQTLKLLNFVTKTILEVNLGEINGTSNTNNVN